MAAPRASLTAAIGRGRALFNSGRYFEAHEAWEEAWLLETGRPRRLLQGLIQLAAALHKASQGGPASGCVRLLANAAAKLEGIADTESGLRLGELREAVSGFRKLAGEWAAGRTTAPPAESFPRLEALEAGAG